MNPLSAFIFLPCCAYQLINLFGPYAIILWWIYDILVIIACLFVSVLFLWLLFTRGGYHETPLVTSTIGVSSWLIAWIIYFKKKIVIASSWRPVCCPLLCTPTRYFLCEISLDVGPLYHTFPSFSTDMV